MIVSACSVVFCCVLGSVLLCSGSPIGDDGEAHHRHRRSAPTLADRTHCQPGDQWPGTRVNTTERLSALRRAMADLDVDAFVIFNDDAHGSEYPADIDKRRGFISGFTGSAGYAAVTMTKAALWTDGRYFLEAEDALDCNWILMKSGQTGVPRMVEWLTSELTAGQVVGADPFLITYGQWQSIADYFKPKLTLTAVTTNPVDTVWTDQPRPPNTPINALPMKYAGKRWQDKIADVHTAMEEEGIHGAYIITNLDEIAWLFNARASDIEFNPFFISYAIVEYYGQSNASNKISLYFHNANNTRLTAEPSDPETTTTLFQHLNTNQHGSCENSSGLCVEVHDYVPSQVVSDISALAAASADSKFWFNSWCNYAIFQAIPEAQRHARRTYITYAKTQKNPVEAQNMQISNNRDAAVLIEFFAKLEKEVKEGKHWTEVSAAAELRRMRKAADKNRGESFASIAGSGPNGAVIHYRPSPESDRQLATTEMFLLDSGGQYLDGTIDTTRTIHFGTPTDFMIESYTRVLMGSIDLAKLVWPKGVYGRSMGILARTPLWAAGMNYRHGTGHGVGAYLSVHDGPVYIGGASRSNAPEIVLPNMFLSDEPGFYQPGEFGIRLETVLMVEPMQTQHNVSDVQYLHFKPVALVPFERKLINITMMSNHQVQWLNDYHQVTQKTMEPLLTSDLAKTWLSERTKPYVTPTSSRTTCPHNPAPLPLPTLPYLPLALALALALTLPRP